MVAGLLRELVSSSGRSSLWVWECVQPRRSALGCFRCEHVWRQVPETSEPPRNKDICESATGIMEFGGKIATRSKVAMNMNPCYHVFFAVLLLQVEVLAAAKRAERAE